MAKSQSSDEGRGTKSLGAGGIQWGLAHLPSCLLLHLQPPPQPGQRGARHRSTAPFVHQQLHIPPSIQSITTSRRCTIHQRHLFTTIARAPYQTRGLVPRATLPSAAAFFLPCLAAALLLPLAAPPPLSSSFNPFVAALLLPRPVADLSRCYSSPHHVVVSFFSCRSSLLPLPLVDAPNLL